VRYFDVVDAVMRPPHVVIQIVSVNAAFTTCIGLLFPSYDKLRAEARAQTTNTEHEQRSGGIRRLWNEMQENTSVKKNLSRHRRAFEVLRVCISHVEFI
jgi:hypothetical protein